MKRVKAATIIASVSLFLIILSVYLTIQHRSIEQASFETYLYDQALLERHKSLCAGILRLSNRCNDVDLVSAQFADLPSLYDQRKLVYDDIEFLLAIEGKHTTRKELRRELKTIRKLIEINAKKRRVARK